MFKRLVIVGASRGLGRAVARFASAHLRELESITLISRKIKDLEDTRRLMAQADPLTGTEGFSQERVVFHAGDMATLAGREACAELIKQRQSDLVVYAAGGGPYGKFVEKNWRDHQWALELGLISPMSLAFDWLKVRTALNPPSPGKFIIVGSRIAEAKPDALAASYAASKHGLLGFVSSLQPELENHQQKVWLFSPGYIDSQMLPLTAKVRHDGTQLLSAETAAQVLLRWAKTDGPWHRVLS